jgi:hypothetical protein
MINMKEFLELLLFGKQNIDLNISNKNLEEKRDTLYNIFMNDKTITEIDVIDVNGEKKKISRDIFLKYYEFRKSEKIKGDQSNGNIL